MSRAFCGSRFHGVLSEKPNDFASVSIIRSRHDLVPGWKRAMAPLSIERSGSDTTLSGSTPMSVPRPEQVGQAPYGELKEKRRGVISESPEPQVAQAKFCDSVSSGSPSGAASTSPPPTLSAV